MMKKQMVIALALLLSIPVVSTLGGLLFSFINPEIAAGHPNYVRNYHYLSLLRTMSALASAAVIGILWLAACFLVIRSKKRSPWWLFLAALGPFGFAILAMLHDKDAVQTDRYKQFVRSLDKFARAGYEVSAFMVIWLLAYQAMILLRYLIVLYQSAATGMSTAQVIDLQNASSGMWAFGEGLEVMFVVVLLYLIRPIVFNVVSRMTALMASPKAS